MNTDKLNSIAKLKKHPVSELENIIRHLVNNNYHNPPSQFMRYQTAAESNCQISNDGLDEIEYCWFPILGEYENKLLHTEQPILTVKVGIDKESLKPTSIQYAVSDYIPEEDTNSGHFSVFKDGFIYGLPKLIEIATDLEFMFNLAQADITHYVNLMKPVHEKITD